VSLPAGRMLPPSLVMRSIAHDVQLPPPRGCRQGRRMTPEQRRLRAQNAAHARWSRHMAREDQAYIARQAMWDRLGREVDPDHELTTQQRAVLIQSAAKRLSARLNAAKARKRSQRTA
jgi:hypothetical protein